MSEIEHSLQVIWLSVDKLKQNPNNVRRRKPGEIQRIADNIRTFGFPIPIVVNESGKVLIGYRRFLAAKQMGMREVPTMCVNHLTFAQVIAFAIADRRLTEASNLEPLLDLLEAGRTI